MLFILPFSVTFNSFKYSQIVKCLNEPSTVRNWDYRTSLLVYAYKCHDIKSCLIQSYTRPRLWFWAMTRTGTQTRRTCITSRLEHWVEYRRELLPALLMSLKYVSRFVPTSCSCEIHQYIAYLWSLSVNVFNLVQLWIAKWLSCSVNHTMMWNLKNGTMLNLGCHMSGICAWKPGIVKNYFIFPVLLAYRLLHIQTYWILKMRN